jgi:hypothetical protein
MLHAQNVSHIHILYTQNGVYIIFEYKKNFEREAFRFSMTFLLHFEKNILSKEKKIFLNALLKLNIDQTFLLHLKKKRRLLGTPALP